MEHNSPPSDMSGTGSDIAEIEIQGRIDDMTGRLIRICRKLYGLLKAAVAEPLPIRERLSRAGALVGKGAFIGKTCVFDWDFVFLLEIGEGAVLSSGTHVILHDSSIPNALGRGKLRVGQILLERRAYVGQDSIILPGVRIGEGAIVGAHSLVNRDVPAGQVWAGSPVRYICSLQALVERREAEHSTAVYDFEWMGELEKLELDYAKVKSKMLQEVRRHFGKERADSTSIEGNYSDR
jgi:maltose O-acetyltransferase